VELHGGTVSALSGGQNQGSTFTVKLPLMVRNTASREAYSSKQKQVLAQSDIAFDSAPRLEGLNLLVVEDEPDARELISTILRVHKAEVRGVASPEEAINLLGEWTPDVLVSDIEMPGEDGYSLIRKIRASEANRGTRMPAVALTAHARVDDRMRALSAGYDAHVAKPVEPAELIMVIASLARRSGA